MPITARIEIQKSPAGYSYREEVKYPDWPNPAITTGGYRTLAVTIWKCALHAEERNYRILSFSVNGREVDSPWIFAKVENALRGSPLDYRLRGMRKYLLEENKGA